MTDQDHSSLRVGILGCAHLHIHDAVELLRRRADVEVGGVWDHDRACARRWAEALEADVADQAGRILEDRSITAVVVMSETSRHPELVEQAVAHGKHLFVEKPLAVSGPRAAEVAEVIVGGGGLFQTGYFLRQLPALRMLRAKVGQGSLGRVVGIRAHLGHRGAIDGSLDRARWMVDREAAGYGDILDALYTAAESRSWVAVSPPCRSGSDPEGAG